MQSAIEALVPVFSGPQRFILTTHVNPDGDGLGSELALAEVLITRGKEVTILNCSPTPANYLFLDPHGRINVYDAEKHASLIAGTDCIVVLDTNQPDRLRSMEQPVVHSAAIKICIDHHPEPAPFAHHYLVDETATSTGELMYRLLLRLSPTLFQPTVATALYCAIMTDTGSFRYSHVDPDIHEIAARLIERGADAEAIYRNVYDQWTPGRIQLLGEALAHLGTEYEGRLAHLTVTREMFRKTGTDEIDTENFTVYPMSIATVRAGILFVELPDGIKMSFRSRDSVPINELAKEFGGNGHRNAAGARIRNRSLSDVKSEVVRAAGKYVEPERKPRV
jgi:phosphoesterase RecJ-like protein